MNPVAHEFVAAADNDSATLHKPRSICADLALAGFAGDDMIGVGMLGAQQGGIGRFGL